MLRLTPIATATAALTLFAGLTACSSSDSDPESGAGSHPSTTATSGTADAVDEPTYGPLDEYVGVGAGVGMTVSDAEMLEYEEAIARCMAAEGFEYVPWVDPTEATFLPDGTITLEEPKPSFPDLPPDEFAARFGFGYSTKPPVDREGDVNPNDAIVAKMSVAERVAYQQALRGKGNQLDDQGYLSGTGISTSDSSCSGRADGDAPTADERMNAFKRAEQVRKSFGSLLKRVRGLRDDEMADPRVTAATGAWSSCLADAGHPGFSETDQPRARARADAQNLLGRDLRGTAQVDPTRLAALRKAEVGLAVADERCMRDWQTTYETVQSDVEQRFVADNIEELEKFRTAMSAAVAAVE